MKGGLAAEIRCSASDGRCRKPLAWVGEIFGTLVITDGHRTTLATAPFAYIEPCPRNHDDYLGPTPKDRGPRLIPIHRDVWEAALVASARSQTVEVIPWHPRQSDEARHRQARSATWL